MPADNVSCKRQIQAIEHLNEQKTSKEFLHSSISNPLQTLNPLSKVRIYSAQYVKALKELKSA